MSYTFGEAEGGIVAPNQDPLSRFLFEPPLKRSVSSFLFEQGSVAHQLHIAPTNTEAQPQPTTATTLPQPTSHSIPIIVAVVWGAPPLPLL